MTYLDKNLLPNEQILFRTKKHLIIFFVPVVWTIFCFYADSYMRHNPFLGQIVWVPWIIALIFWLTIWLEYITSEFAITSRRVMMREGFFYRHANEMRVATISQVNITQSLLGQLLNYGTVSINAFGATDAYTLINKPYQFQKILNTQLDQIVK